MAPLVETRRVRRNWTEKFLLWPRAYETKVWQSGHEVTGRGSTPGASEEAAMMNGAICTVDGGATVVDLPTLPFVS